MNGLSIEELASIIGFKEIELYQTRKELAQTRAVLEQVTRGETPQEEVEKPLPEAWAQEAADADNGAVEQVAAATGESNTSSD